jgi:hypothetical protein
MRAAFLIPVLLSPAESGSPQFTVVMDITLDAQPLSEFQAARKIELTQRKSPPAIPHRLTRLEALSIVVRLANIPYCEVPSINTSCRQEIPRPEEKEEP